MLREMLKKAAIGCLFSFFAAVPASATDFDFYVLSLSWSPSYCAAEGASANRDQCGTNRPYAFVVHGLWPQNERGYPSDCNVQNPDVPRAISGTMLDIMPSRGLIRHQWRKHGSCSGLSQRDYFATTRRAYQRIRIPDHLRQLSDYKTVSPREVEQAFVEANPGLRSDAVAVDCDRRYMREVRICLTKDLQFRSCREVDARACRTSNLVMPPVRGRN
ncbi:ribonuclease T2 family protein [Limoniibacter endophyticus]